MKIQTRNVKLAIKKGKEIIADYKQHSNGKLTLWTSINNHTEKYNITAEAQSKVKPGITTAIVAQLPSPNSNTRNMSRCLYRYKRNGVSPS